MTDTTTHSGKCFCGAVAFSVSGEPAAMGFCHCLSCREWSAAPVNAFTLWRLDDVKITEGAESIGSYRRTPNCIRKWCMIRGGHLFSEVPPWSMADVFAAAIPTLNFVPTLHVHYQEAVLAIRDGLPKQKDLPRELGGSGELLPE